MKDNFWRKVTNLMVSVDPDYNTGETKAYRNGLTVADDSHKYRRLADGDSGWDYLYENITTGSRKKELASDDFLVIDDFKEAKQFFFYGVIPFTFIAVLDMLFLIAYLIG